jgi:hypothetical protein
LLTFETPSRIKFVMSVVLISIPVDITKLSLFFFFSSLSYICLLDNVYVPHESSFPLIQVCGTIRVLGFRV